MSNLKIAMVFGTFDILHPGHINFLKQAKKYGDYLIVVIARDKTVLKVKDRKPKNSENKRMLAVKNSGLADRVILGMVKNKYALIKKYEPDIICLGYDQNIFTDKLKEKIKKFKLKTKIIRLKSFKPNIYKSSKL